LINDWPPANDAGTIDVTRAKGVITGMVGYLDHVIVFTEHSMHELYGTGPGNYELIDVEGAVGCISHRSLTTCNAKLFWMWYDGIYMYSGGSAVKVSKPVQSYIDAINFTYKAKIVGGSMGEFLYMSIPSSGIILKYDANLNKWYVETGTFYDFVTIGNVLYGIDSAGQAWNVRDLSATKGKDGASWIATNWISKPFNILPSEDLNVSEIYTVVDMTTNSTTLTLGWDDQPYNNDSTSFTTLHTFTPSSNVQCVRTFAPSSPPLNWYRLRFAGSGHVEVHNLEVKGGVG